ncbi:uncharacterized protein UMAG_15082 [Mycosarcoma maydis]|uniref:SET domain-containing protein n=1 Tax=Mycosarcoma maydis TaxID=5270 RepID=A0A0D1CNC6_MYCMD|nr:uncharacterized protein UMAG_15082 [Ustilago maydis 521]KIS68158.1 hypothetical protein UMAG_15082 [Ustilago maydis 521]|eukprot:XP_011390362.1 hypothetical protein UMAG_15082 [Ustilago maydis 521]
MIKPPAMGVFARDPPPVGRGGASSSLSNSQLGPLPSDIVHPLPSSSALSTMPTHQSTSHPVLPDDEAAQNDDDDDQGTVDEEAGVIRCICGCDDDDGFTIQCDRCLVWQHCACFGMSQASVPEEYLCEQCEPRPVDVVFAQAHQQKRKNNEARKALMDRNLKRHQQALASTTTYTHSHLPQDAVSSPTSAAHPLTSALSADVPSLTLHQNPQPSSSSSSSSISPSTTTAARARKPSQALDLSNTQFVVPELPASAASASTAHRGGKQRRGPKASRRGHDTPSSVSTPVRGVFTPGSSHDRAEDPFDLADQLEAWHVEFTPIAKNIVVDPSILDTLATAILDWEDASPLKAVPGPAGRLLVPTAPRASTSTKPSHLDSILPSSSSSSSSTLPSSPSSSPLALASPGPDAEPLAISAVGQECVPVELAGPSLADLACRTYVRHISESASAGVFTNLLYVNNSADEPQRSWCASRAFSRPVMHGLFAEASIPAGAFISELRGEIYSADTYRNNPINQYAALGATKPHVHLLPPPLNLAIDARRFGNEARFARYSCHPNAVLRPILFDPTGQPSARSHASSRAQSPAPSFTLSALPRKHADTPPAESRSDEPQLFFGLFALTDIPRTHEITVGWEWDDAHIVHFLPQLVQESYLESRQGHVDADQHTANMQSLDDGETGCGSNEAIAKRNDRKDDTSTQTRIDKSDHNSAPSDVDADDDDTRSLASSLTDPMSGLSDNDTISEDEDHDLMDALQAAADGLHPHRRSAKGGDANAVDTELSGLFLLPPKKRSMRTRIKAVVVPSDDDSATNEDIEGEDDATVQNKSVKARRSAEMAPKSKSATKRKGKLDAARTALHFSSDEDKHFDDSSAAIPARKRRKAGNIADPSSPLSSVPSPSSDTSMPGSPPDLPRLSVKHRFENERRLSDIELAKKKRAAKRGQDSRAKTSQSRPKESASKRRKREEARIHRNAILDLGDTESSEEGLSVDDELDGDQQHRHDDGDTTMADVESRTSTTSTPRMSHKSLGPRGTDITNEAQAASDTTLLQKTNKETLPKPSTTEDPKSAQSEATIKAKKVRRILSDSEASADEETAHPAASTPTTADEYQTSQARAKQSDEPDRANLESTDATADARPKFEEDAVTQDAITSGQASAATPTPVAQVKKEEPRVKLSLAEYKRRLAERRVSEQQSAQSKPPLTPVTPTPATPTSDVAPMPSPAIERSEPPPPAPARSSQSTLTPAETVATCTSLAPPSTTAVSDAVETSMTPASAPRAMLFTSISAPTAIRSVEIPKSPSPEPTTNPSAQQQQSSVPLVSPSKELGTVHTEETDTTVTVDSGASSNMVGPASSPASNTSTLPLAAAGADTPALLMRLETRQNRASSVSQQPATVEQTGSMGSTAAIADADGFARPLTTSTGQTTTPTATTWGASTPLRSPSFGATRTQTGGRMPPSPSTLTSFNPPKAPRAFMSPPGTNLPPPSMAPASSIATSASAAASSSSATPTIAAPSITSTPARIGTSGAAIGVANTPSTASSASSAASSRYPALSHTSPTPASTALPASSAGYPPRNFAGVPKAPASMRDTDPRAEAWAEAREAREARDARGDYAPRHHDPMREGGASRDMGWGERSREPVGMGEREPMRGGWGRDRRDLAHARAGYGRDDRVYGRDDLAPGGSSVSSEVAGGSSSAGLADRLESHAHSHVHSHSHSHSHSHYGPYRRPSVTEYDNAVRGGPVSPYDRPSDPYNRGIGIRGRSLVLGGGGLNASGANSSGVPPPPPPAAAAAVAGRDNARVGDYRDYDDLAGGGGGPPPGHTLYPRGGFRSSGGGGWGGRGRARGGGRGGHLEGGGRGRGGWMR